MGLRVMAMFFIFAILMLSAMPPIYACGYCLQPPYHNPSPPTTRRPSPPPVTINPPSHGGRPKVSPPLNMPPVFVPPPVIISPPVMNPPVTIPPPSSTYPPYTGNPPLGGGFTPPSGGLPGINPPPPSTSATCPINGLKLGLCVDVLGGLVHIGLGNPVENTCCPLLEGLLELEAAVCFCTSIRLKLLNLNIFIPLALQVLITCGKTPPPGFGLVLLLFVFQKLNTRGTFEARWEFVATGVDKQAERKRNVEVDAQNVSFDGNAKAESNLKVEKALEEGATWGGRRGPYDNADQPAQ
ncbi:hypothetical protein HHK36_027974 [Tetracentron sinense]|uniref:Hydrophobic seed protein domain-containing protein n=1 Tax=Tetracentron sinense TaxID=13715 RepID=A0A835D1Q1_TETSI|nr:hypothetical protein HHK36_027974 [Tetracentron sinense]